MRLLGRWDLMVWRRKLPAASVREMRIEAAPASGLDDLQVRLNLWSNLWAQDSESTSRSEAQQLVAERLSRWLERCFGQHVQNSLRGNQSHISLASSTPIFTAFLGRRATRELSRRVLQDI